MQTVTLNNGVQMPILGFGVFQIPDAAECERVVSDALEIGYRLIDTAAAYGNEEAVGRAIRSSGVPRDELFVTTKLWIPDAGEEKVKVAFQRSLDQLGLEKLDLCLIHEPFGDVYGAWRGMETLHGEGRVRAIGVSNFYPDRLQDLVDHNDVVPAVNQIETHVFFQRQEDQKLMQSLGVQQESWGPFAEGKNDFFTNPLLKGIADRFGKSVGQVALRWMVQRGVVVIPKSVRKTRMAENLGVFDFELTQADMDANAELDTGKSLFLDHRDPQTVHHLSTVGRD